MTWQRILKPLQCSFRYQLPADGRRFPMRSFQLLTCSRIARNFLFHSINPTPGFKATDGTIEMRASQPEKRGKNTDAFRIEFLIRQRVDGFSIPKQWAVSHNLRSPIAAANDNTENIFDMTLQLLTHTLHIRLGWLVHRG